MLILKMSFMSLTSVMKMQLESCAKNLGKIVSHGDKVMFSGFCYKRLCIYKYTFQQ